MNYKDMTDPEINRRIAALQSFDETKFDQFFKSVLDASIKTGRLDYCNNWADIGPLIETLLNEGHFIAFEGDQITINMTHLMLTSGNITRALAECYLMIKESES